MALQNRVTPFSTIEADPARGQLMGNRGILHGQKRQLETVRWRHKAWVCCALEHTDNRGRAWHRTVMTPGAYTELFFLDEVTALAAGHRPCALCRRSAWQHLMKALEGSFKRTPDLDTQLHRERVPAIDNNQYSVQECASLPDGAMIRHEGKAMLVWLDRLLQWSFEGYSAPRAIPSSLVEVLTPPTLIAALRAGYKPHIHNSVKPLLAARQI